MKPLLVFVAILGISGVTAQGQDHRTNHPHVVSIAGHPRLTSHSTIHILSDAQLTAAPISKPISSGALRLMLDEAIGMALQNNTGIRLAAASIQAKAFAADIARSDYFPKFSAAAGAIRFNEDLGKVVRLLGSGPAEVDIINQNSTYAGVFAGQPLTQLLTIKQAVQLADADRRIAQAQLRGGRRDLAYGVTQLFYGLLTAQQMQGAAQLQLGVAQASKGQTAARIAMLQAQQAKMQADGQVTQLQQQLNSLLCVPIDTHLELVEPPLPERIVIDVEQAVSQAIRCDPEVREAYEGVAKACAGMKIAKLSYIPAIDVVGGYLNQEVLNIVDEKDIGFIGVTGSVSIFEGGKRRATLNERRTQVAMAQHNLRMVKEKARLAARKVYRDYEGAWAALQMADEILQIRKEATKQGGPKASQELIGVEKAAELEVMKAEINYRLAHAQLMSVIEGSGVPKTSNQ